MNSLFNSIYSNGLSSICMPSATAFYSGLGTAGISYFSCPPFGHFISSVKRFLSILSVGWVFGSSPLSHSSFRRSTASGAQSVAGHAAVPHEIAIRKGSRAAFTLSHYSSQTGLLPVFEGCKSQSSQVIGEPYLTGLPQFSKGQDKTAVRLLSLPRVLSSVIELFSRLCCFLFIRRFIFKSFKSYIISSIERFVGVISRLKRGIGYYHLPEYSGKSSCHSGSCLSFDAGFLDKSLIAFFEVGVKLGQLKRRLAKCPSECSRAGFGYFSLIGLSVGDMASFCKPCPTGNGIGVFESLKISEFSHYNKTQSLTNAFDRCDYLKPLPEMYVLGDNTSCLPDDEVLLLLNKRDSVLICPESKGLCFVEFITLSQDVSLKVSGGDVFWSSAVCVEHLPSCNGFDFSRFLRDSMPLSCEHSQPSYFLRWGVCGGDMFVFHNVGDFACGYFVSISHPWPQLAQIERVDKVYLLCEWFKQVPEPVIASHRFDTDAQRFGEIFCESGDFACAVVGDGCFSYFTCNVVNCGVSSRSSV
jgi:hypothetical protein